MRGNKDRGPEWALAALLEFDAYLARKRRERRRRRRESQSEGLFEEPEGE